jgi:hypothetical protein
MATLDKVKSDRKRNEILRILYDPYPEHFQKVWLVGFLHWVGYDRNEIIGIIKNLNRWVKFDLKVTSYMVDSVLKSYGNDCRNVKKESLRPAGRSPAPRFSSQFSFGFGKPIYEHPPCMKAYLDETKDTYQDIDHKLSLLNDLVEAGQVKDTDTNGGISIAEWTNMGKPELMDIGYGRFIEIAKRTNGKTTGIAISTGQFGLTKDGNKDINQKRYNKGNVFLTLDNGVIEDFIDRLRKLAKLG